MYESAYKKNMEQLYYFAPKLNNRLEISDI